MKTFAFLLSFLTVSFSFFAQEKTKGLEKPAIEFVSTEINKGDIKYAADESFVFEFKNNGRIPIIVTNVQAACGCTTPSKPEEPIQPGKTGKIVAKYDTKRVGDFTKTISVTTNVNEQPIVLTIKGKVAPQQ